MNKTWTDISSLHELYKSQKIKPSEVVGWYLERISKLNPMLNAFITVTSEEAIKKALILDTKINEINQYPLFGVPVAFKDIYMTEGIKTTAGAKLLENYIGQYDATVVKKYLDAGAICVGKLNCDAWAHGSSGENSDFGPTRNPWNTDYVSGGSSSGAAVAIAADLCMVTGGTDTGGSIRCPASFCGVTGFKPTYGRVSRYGIIAMASSLDSVGHFSWSAENCARVLSITAGFDAYDATSSTKPIPAFPIKNSPRKLRIGVPGEFQATDLEVQKIVAQAIDQIAKIYKTSPVSVSLPHSSTGLATYYIIQPAEVSSNLARFDGIRFGHDRTYFSAEAKRRIMLGTHTLSSGYYDAYYNTAQKVRTKVIEDFDQAFKQVDILLSPVMPHPAFKIGEKNTDPLSLYLEDILTVTVNLAGLPALSIPCGFTSNKLPVGLQIIAPQFAEDLLFSVAKSYQNQTHYHEQKPTL